MSQWHPAYRAGYYAYRAGRQLLTNPHRVRSRWWYRWRKGWLDGLTIRRETRKMEREGGDNE